MCRSNLWRRLDELDQIEASLIIELEACDPIIDALERFSIEMELENLMLEKEALLVKLDYL
mgnify:CR=1 FL=1|jgi:hypothetical protein